MAKTLVDFTTYLAQTVKALADPGLLLAAEDSGSKPNVMAIGWATLGIIWGKPVCVVLVRPSRYTYQLIESSGAYSVNVPTPELSETVMYCGTVSGREHDKFQEKGLTALPATRVGAPLIQECPINYECKVVHKNDVIPAELAPEVQKSAYPAGDYHRVYFGEILAVHAEEGIAGSMPV
jgi:flavin reductase (DIM6/NTAB) family NADH-FMN oxidoreductase RutF